MRKSLLFVLFSFLLFPLSILAAQGLFDTGPAPSQSFHAAGTAKNSNESAAKQMAKVKSIMAEAKKKQLAKQTAKVINSQSGQPVPAVSKAATAKKKPVLNNSSTRDLATEISTLNQTNLLFHQQTNQKIEELSYRNKALEDKIQKLDEALVLLNQEVTQMNHELQLAKSQMNGSKGGWLQELNAKFGGDFKYLIYAILIVLVVLVTMLVTHKHANKSKKPKSPSDEAMKIDDADDEVSGEYDFMGSEEAIPAKLDLARAYISMEDYAAAKSVLAEVLSRGEDEQRKIAQELLTKIPSQS